MKDFEKNFAKFIIKWRWPVILLNVLLVFSAAYGLQKLQFTNNYRIFFSKDNPELLAFEKLENMFSKNDNALFVFAPDDGNIFTNRNLEALSKLTTEAWQLPYSTRVESITNFQYTEADQDELIVRDLVQDPGKLSQAELDKIRDISLHEPLLYKKLISDRGHVAAVNVTMRLPGIHQDTENPEAVAAIRKLAKKIETEYPGTRIYLTGMIMMDNAFTEASQNDIKGLIPISFALMMLLVGFFIRSIAGTFGTLIIIGFSIITALGAGAWLGLPMSTPAAAAPVIILTVAIANSVHILLSLLHGLRKGLDKESALIESLRINLQPVFLSSITTAIGFLMMNFSDVPPFRHLGNFVAIGVLSSFIMSITLLPAFIYLLPLKEKNIGEKSDPVMSAVANFVIKFKTRILWITGSIVFISIIALPLNQLNDIFVNYFDPSIKFRTDTDFTKENLTGIYTIDYSLSADQPGGISDPEFLREVENFANWYRQQPEVVHVISLTDIMKRLNKNMHADHEDMYKLPEQRDLAAQYLLLFEMSLPYGLDLNNQINVDKSSIRMVVTLPTLSSNQLLALEDRAQQWLSHNSRVMHASPGTGTSMMFAHIGKRNIKSMLIGTTLALCLISMILIFALRSVRIGLISLLPNLVPAAVAFGLWGIFVGEIGLSLSVVTTMTFGIVVDDTVHFLSKYLRARREKNLSSEQAVSFAFISVGRALVITSVVLVVGFLVLATSSFELNSGMGLLTAIVITIALLADFLLLPSLLMKLEERTDEETVISDSGVDAVIP